MIELWIREVIKYDVKHIYAIVYDLSVVIVLALAAMFATLIEARSVEDGDLETIGESRRRQVIIYTVAYDLSNRSRSSVL